MPLVASAILAYAAGLLAGFGGVPLSVATAIAIAAAALSVPALDARRSVAASLALLGLCGAAVARASDARAARCRVEAARSRLWTASLDDDAEPGAYARGTLRGDGGCAAHIRLHL